MALGLFAQIGIIAHLYSLLDPALGAQHAGWAVGLVTAMAVVGRTCIGWFMPVDADCRLLASACYALPVVGSVTFILAAGASVPLLLTGVVLFGLAFGIGTWLPPLIAEVGFVKDDVQRVVSLNLQNDDSRDLPPTPALARAQATPPVGPMMGTTVALDCPAQHRVEMRASS